MFETPPPSPDPYASPIEATPIYNAEIVETSGDGTGGLIPYKNPTALTAYYLGLFSLFPCLGIALAIPAFILGVIGLKRRKANPIIKGSIHAWIGVVMGGLMTLIWGACIVVLLWGMFNGEFRDR